MSDSPFENNAQQLRFIASRLRDWDLKQYANDLIAIATYVESKENVPSRG